MGCGQIEFLTGGVLTQVSVTDSTVQGSKVSDSTISSSSIDTLTSIDSASAKVIADAIADLSADDVKALAALIAQAMVVQSTSAPVTDAAESLPTTMAGSRTMLLGEPKNWLAIGGLAVPAYEEG